MMILCASAAFASFSGWAPAIEIQGGYYGAIPTAAYLESEVPIRTQGEAKIYLDALSFSINRFQAGGAFFLGYVTPSLAFNQTQLKGFISYGARVYFSYFISDVYCLGLGAEIAVNNSGTDVKFGSVSGILYNEFLFSQTAYVNFSVLAPIEVSYRKDIVAVSVSCGFKVRYKGYWIQEGL